MLCADVASHIVNVVIIIIIIIISTSTSDAGSV